MKQKQNNNPNSNQDVLEAYPEKEQVDAFPERRYIKLTRFLTIVAIVNLALVIACSGLYFYMIRHKDITINYRNWVHLYSIDPERKLLLPSEPTQVSVSAMQLVMEKALRQYLEERYASIWDVDEMRKRWGEEGYVARFSHPDIAKKFTDETARVWMDIWQKRITRDVHI